MQKRSLKELINTVEPGWPLVQEWIAAAHNTVEVLDVDRARAEEVLLHMQVTTRSPLGAIAFETGGILIDHGWLRFLGSGHQRICGDLRSWNGGEVVKSQSLQATCIIAYAVIGGFFALNGGAFPGQPGTVFYCGPEALQWENLNLSYSQFFNWALTEKVDPFYQNMRWPRWEQEISLLNGDQGLSVYPFLFAESGMPVAERSRRPVSLKELWHLYVDDPRKAI